MKSGKSSGLFENEKTSTLIDDGREFIKLKSCCSAPRRFKLFTMNRIFMFFLFIHLGLHCCSEQRWVAKQDVFEQLEIQIWVMFVFCYLVFDIFIFPHDWSHFDKNIKNLLKQSNRYLIGCWIIMLIDLCLRN